MTNGQLPLLPGARRGRPSVTRVPASDGQHVARVALMLGLPHLDRPFDYAVPRALEQAAAPGTRVRVRFSGRLVDGFVLDRIVGSQRELAPISSVHGPPVLTDEVARLCRSVADRYAGTLADVLRFAVPARHARAERSEWQVEALGQPAERPVADDAPAWAAYDGGKELVAGIGGQRPVRALWVAGPGEQVPDRLAELVRAVRARGRGVILVAPDGADVERLAAGLERIGVPAARLTAELGPQARYRAFLSVLGGGVGAVVGTRAAVLAPVVDLGAIIVWDDADESLSEPQAPGWHAREVAAMRSAAGGDISLVLAGPSASLEAARMAASGWLSVCSLPRAALRERMPRVQAAAEMSDRNPQAARSRIPGPVLGVLREGLARGPVLVAVPRAGYLPALACGACREQATCPTCAAPLRAEASRWVPVCPVHGALHAWSCSLCGSSALRAAVVGVARTAEEFGRALPGATVVTSSGEHPVRQLDTGPATLVVATPGCEPDPGPQGYAALVVLDADAALSRPGLRVAEDQLRRWLAAACLVRPAGQGGRVLVAGEPDLREVQALIRWDPLGYAQRELDERRALSLPPSVRTAQLVGPALPAGELAHALAQALGDAVVRLAGPIPGDGDSVTWLVATSIADGARLAAAVQREQAARSASRAPVVTSRMDPVRLR